MQAGTNVPPKKRKQSDKTVWRNVEVKMERLAKYMMDHCKTPTGVSEKAKPAIGRHLSTIEMIYNDMWVKGGTGQSYPFSLIKLFLKNTLIPQDPGTFHKIPRKSYRSSRLKLIVGLFSCIVMKLTIFQYSNFVIIFQIWAKYVKLMKWQKLAYVKNNRVFRNPLTVDDFGLMNLSVSAFEKLLLTCMIFHPDTRQKKWRLPAQLW